MDQNDRGSVTICPIGVIRSCFSERFGIPRQSGLAPSATAVIELMDPFCREEMVRGLEKFSHIWVQFIFHEAVEEGWKATVRPPRLGGKERLGVYSTRSPHRPNHIGLSAVRLLAVKHHSDKVSLDVGGIDHLDGTPVIDIKPYIPYSDSIPDANNGWLAEEFPVLQVSFKDEAKSFCDEYQSRTGRRLSRLIIEILREDPRPASQRKKRSDFGMNLWDVNVRWMMTGSECTIMSCMFK